MHLFETQWMKDRAKTSTAPDHLVIFVNSYRMICKTCICILICTTLLVEKYNLDTGTLGAEVFGVFFYILGSMQLILYVSFTPAVYELGHNTVHVFLLGVPNQTPSCFYFEACLFIQTTMWFSQIQGTEGNVYFNRFIENRMKKKTTIDYYKPQVVVLFSLWNNSYMYHARGLLNRFWLTFSSSSFIQRGVDLDTCEWQCWKCVRVCQQRKNSYTAVSNGSNINLPKQSVFMNSILWYNKRNKTWIIHHTLKCSERTLKKVFIDLKWSAWNSFQRQCHIHHCRPVFYDQHVMLIDNSYHGL